MAKGAKVTIIKSPTVLEIEKLFPSDLEKASITSWAMSSAISSCKMRDLQEVLTIVGTSEYGKGAYAIAMEPAYFPGSKNNTRCCRTEVYQEKRTEDEITHYLSVYEIPNSTYLPHQIISMAAKAPIVKAHFNENLTLRILDSDEAMQLLDEEYEKYLFFSKPLGEQIRERDEKMQQFAEKYKDMMKNITAIHIKNK